MTTRTPTFTRLRWRPFELPMRHRFEAAHGALATRAGVILELTDAQGRTGLGEASPMASLGYGSVEDVLAILERSGGDLLRRYAPPALPGVEAVRCARDVAALDLRAQAEGVPIAVCLGGDPRREVPANAVIGGGTPSEMAGFAAEAWEQGYRVLKLKVGTGTVTDDVERVTAVRAACPDATIRLDANGAWDESTARAAIARLAPAGIELIEQPVAADDIEGLARLRESSAIPIAADESVTDSGRFRRILETHAADVVVLKPMFLGGIAVATRMAAAAEERGIGAFVTTTFDSSIGIAAAVHLAAALPWAGAHGLSTGAYLGADVTSATLMPEADCITVPDGSGLGVRLDERALDAVATGPWRQVSA